MEKMEITQKLIYPALDEILSVKHKSVSEFLKPETSLIGEKAVLDSLGLVSFITIVEENIQNLLKKNIVLADEKVFSRTSSPFKTVSSLTDFIFDLIHE